jgi:hypothetical protein
MTVAALRAVAGRWNRRYTSAVFLGTLAGNGNSGAGTVQAMSDLSPGFSTGDGCSEGAARGKRSAGAGAIKRIRRAR